jgi:hypothetical protein
MTFTRLLLLTSLLTAPSAFADITQPDGDHPDLSGVYDTGTLTPLNRPAEFGDQQFMNAQEATRVLQAIKKRYQALERETSSADRGAPQKGGDGNNNFGAGGVGGYNAFWIDPGNEVNQVNGNYRTSIIYDPPNGRQPAMTPTALKRRSQIYGSFGHNNDGTASWLGHDGPGPFDGPESLAPSERCLISFGATVPTLPSLYNNYKRIVQTDEHIMILQEMVHDARIIRMNAEHSPSANRKWMGDSVGRWEGDTLIVHTVNFKPMSSLGGADEHLEVIERFKLAENGDLIYNFTVNNPTAWTAPWSGEYAWNRKDGDKVYEYACHEGNYAMGNVLRGARLLESEWAGTPGGGD